MDKRLYYQADCRRLNRRATLETPADRLTPAEKLLDRILPQNHQAASLEPDLPLFKKVAGLIASIKERIDWEQGLAKASYVVFDTETTGLHPFKGDEIIAIGAVLVKDGAIMEQPVFDRLINPLRPISPQTRKITGITVEMLQDQPTICTVLTEFLEFIGPRILVAHNAPFDLAFLNLKIGEAIGTRMINPVIDTVMLTSSLHPSLGDYSLEGLAPRFKLDLSGRHSALGDARITAELFLSLLPQLIEAGVSTVPQLARLLCETDQQTGFPLIF